MTDTAADATGPAILAAESRRAAEAAGLRYVTDTKPGLIRRRQGKGWSYRQADGSLVTDPAARARIGAIVIPPAWTDVWICRDPAGHSQATGRDGRGRKVYCYHPAWRELRDADKFDRLASFGAALPDLRAAVDADLRRRGLPEEKVLALVVRLLDDSLIRVGNDAYAEENGSYGLTTLLPEHVEVDADLVSFDFVGKSGLDHQVALADRRLARIIHACHELGGQELFAYETPDGPADVGSADVNAYLRRLTGDAVTAKDFRTWGGSAIATATLALSRLPEGDRDVDAVVLGAYDVAAELLGNTRAVCRACYVHPAVPAAYREGSLHEFWRRSRASTGLERKERALLKLLAG
ncbi:DNA topoisomerase IB [soil metagenome]